MSSVALYAMRITQLPLNRFYHNIHLTFAANKHNNATSTAKSNTTVVARWEVLVKC